jgi:putative endonuclease
MAATSKTNLGSLGEKAAAQYLKSQGYEILDLNFKNNLGRRLGEIDIVAKDKDELVFVEVKTRDLIHYETTLPEENITYSKLRKLAKIASAYIRLKNLENLDYRFDAVSVWLDQKSGQSEIKHILSL